MYIPRDLEKTILKYLPAPEIIAVVGPRQCGKTTLLQHLLKDLKKAVYITFDDRNALDLFENHLDDFVTAYVKGNQYLFIDEFHYAQNGGKILKYLYDTQKIKIIISGSSATDLTIKAIKYLVGRILVFNLYPFNFREFLLAKNQEYWKLYESYKKKIDLKKKEKLQISTTVHQKLLNYYEEYLLFGGYPRVVLEENQASKKTLLQNIYNTYFLREVKDILGLIDDYKLNNLIKGLALQIGNLIEYNELSRFSGFSYPSLKKYINFLEKTYICYLSKPFFKNKKKEIVKNPKAYFFDTGLRNLVVNDFRFINDRPDKGALLENGLVMQMIKEGFKFNFWRDKRKNEVDFVIDLGNNRIVAVEVKSYLKKLQTSSINAFHASYPQIPLYFAYENIAPSLKDSLAAYPLYLL